MIKNINNVDICYEDYGKKNGNALVFLHGWGQNIEMMKPLGNAFLKNNRVVIIDLPGFGSSSEPNEIWSIYDYADCVYKLLEELKVKNPVLLGHSFGGKISLAYASKYKVDKLVVFGSPFRKDIEKISWKTKLLKKLKQIPGMEKISDIAKKYIGSTDYKNASPRMRDILVNHVNLDITEDVKKISCPTLIIWGTLDEAVSIEDARKLEKLIPDAGLVEYPNCTHYAYLENLNQTINVLHNFLGE